MATPWSGSVGLVEETPDATLEALRQKMGVSGSRMIICRALQKLGLPLKKKSPHASERDTPEVQEERREFAEEVEPIEPETARLRGRDRGDDGDDARLRPGPARASGSRRRPRRRGSR